MFCPFLFLIFVPIGGVIANFLLTFLLASGTAVTSGIGHPSFYSGLTVTTTSTASSPAEKAGIKINDVILKINDQEIVGSERAISDFIGTIRASPNKQITLEVFKNTKNLNSKEIEAFRKSSEWSADKVEKLSLVPVEGKNKIIYIFQFSIAFSLIT